MKQRILSAGALAATAVLLSGNVRADNIATIQGYPANTLVTLGSSPVITAIATQPGTFNGHTFTSWGVIAQDGTGSVELYGALPSGSTYTPTVGDTISAAGTYSPYHQIPEIGTLTSIAQLSVGNPVPASPIASIAALNSSLTIPQNLAGYPVEIDAVSLFTDSAATIAATGLFPNGNTPYYIKDSGGNIMEFYFWVTSYSTDAAMIGTPISAGPFDMVGLLSQSGTFPVEVTPIQIPEPSSLALAGLGLLGLLAVRRPQR